MRKRFKEEGLIETKIEYGRNQSENGKIEVSGSLLVLMPPASQQ